MLDEHIVVSERHYSSESSGISCKVCDQQPVEFSEVYGWVVLYIYLWCMEFLEVRWMAFCLDFFDDNEQIHARGSSSSQVLRPQKDKFDL